MNETVVASLCSFFNLLFLPKCPFLFPKEKSLLFLFPTQWLLKRWLVSHFFPLILQDPRDERANLPYDLEL